MVKQPLPPIISRRPDGVLFERVRIRERDAELCVIVNEFEDYGLIVKDGLVMDTIQGGKCPVFTKEEIRRNSVAAAEAIFISKKSKILLVWGTRTSFELDDPATNRAVQIGMNGTVGLQVANPRKFYAEIVGRNEVYDKEALRGRILARLLSVLKAAAAEYIIENGLSCAKLERYLDKLADAARLKLAKAFIEEYGLNAAELTIDGIIVR